MQFCIQPNRFAMPYLNPSPVMFFAMPSSILNYYLGGNLGGLLILVKDVPN